MRGPSGTGSWPVQKTIDLMLASIRTGTNEIMSLIIASEWYKEYFLKKDRTNERDMEDIAAQAHLTEEKVYKQPKT
jgi:hypothetical protein